jgi:hypothetical protein
VHPQSGFSEPWILSAYVSSLAVSLAPRVPAFPPTGRFFGMEYLGRMRLKLSWMGARWGLDAPKADMRICLRSDLCPCEGRPLGAPEYQHWACLDCAYIAHHSWNFCRGRAVRSQPKSQCGGSCLCCPHGHWSS